MIIFKISYLLNKIALTYSRACGQKNIRCFPSCAEEHVEKHFCGKPLRIFLEMLIRRPNKEYVGLDDIRLIAEFKMLDAAYGIHSSVPSSDLKAKIKSKFAPTNPFFLGRIMQSEPPIQTNCGGMLHRCTVDFNAECKGWHYSWVGSRFRTCVSHVIAVTVLSVDHKASSSAFVTPRLEEEEDEGAVDDEEEREKARLLGASVVFKPVAHFDSPSFQVASLRRKSDRAGYLLGSVTAPEHQFEGDAHQQQPPPPFAFMPPPLPTPGGMFHNQHFNHQ